MISYREELKRKLVHLSSLWMPALILLVESRWFLGILFGVLALLSLAAEYGYSRKWPFITPLYGRFFGKMLRKEPKVGSFIVSGGPYVLLAALMMVVIFPRIPAAAGMTVMLTADAAAALIGRRFGRHKAPNHKSLEGVGAFLIVALVVQWIVFGLTGTFSVYWLAAFPAAIVAASAELFEKQIHIDDNFSIPLAIGVVLWLV